MRKIYLISLSLLMAFILVGCGTPNTTSPSPSPSSADPTSASTSAAPSDVPSPSPSTQKALDLSGEWNQVNSESKTSYQIATITKDSIEVYWIDDSASTKSLYWAGSYAAPSSAADSYKWDSKNNKDKTASAMLASGADTKTFTYKNGQISYDVSAMGVTKTVKLEKK